MTTSHRHPLIVSAIALLLAAPSAFAAQINYGSHMGTHVTFENVTENTGADEPLPLFGAPIVTGDSIDFNPIGFDAATANGGSDPTNGNLVFNVDAHLGSRIEQITLMEVGDTTLGGNVTPGSMNTASGVFASGTLDIHEVDFQDIDHISVPFSFTFSPSGGTYFLGTDGGGGPVFHTQFVGSVTLPVTAILVANGFAEPMGATRVSIDLDNTLQTVSEPGTSSIIHKTDFGGLVTVREVRSDIPEPAGAALAGLALAYAALARRQRCA